MYNFLKKENFQLVFYILCSVYVKAYHKISVNFKSRTEWYRKILT